MQDERTLYEELGGEAGVRKLVERFYHHMAQMPDAANVRALHPEDLSGSIQKLFEFLSGWSGGPQLYVAKHGHPRLRARHLPFAIGKRERDQWMVCMVHAIEDLRLEDPVRSSLIEAFLHVADHMRNQNE